jgi:glucosylceramidase
MKQPRVYNHGVLRWEPEILEAYALYLLRFVQAYQAEGLPVHQLHVQNEPNSDQKFPSRTNRCTEGVRAC